MSLTAMVIFGTLIAVSHGAAWSILSSLLRRAAEQKILHRLRRESETSSALLRQLREDLENSEALENADQLMRSQLSDLTPWQQSTILATLDHPSARRRSGYIVRLLRESSQPAAVRRPSRGVLEILTSAEGVRGSVLVALIVALLVATIVQSSLLAHFSTVQTATSWLMLLGASIFVRAAYERRQAAAQMEFPGIGQLLRTRFAPLRKLPKAIVKGLVSGRRVRTATALIFIVLVGIYPLGETLLGPETSVDIRFFLSFNAVVVVVLGVLWVLADKRPTPLSHLQSLKPSKLLPRLRSDPILIATFIGIGALIGLRASFFEIDRVSTDSILLSLISAVILIPLVEQAYLRGFVQNGMDGEPSSEGGEPPTGAFSDGMVVSTITFTGIHMPSIITPDVGLLLAGLLAVATMGWVFGFIYQRTASLVWPFLLHASVNLNSSALLGSL